jgi:hypothetical protein
MGMKINIYGTVWEVNSDGEWTGRDQYGLWHYNGSHEFQTALDLLYRAKGENEKLRDKIKNACESIVISVNGIMSEIELLSPQEEK